MVSRDSRCVRLQAVGISHTAYVTVPASRVVRLRYGRDLIYDIADFILQIKERQMADWPRHKFACTRNQATERREAKL